MPTASSTSFKVPSFLALLLLMISSAVLAQIEEVPVLKDSIAYSMEEALEHPLDIKVLDLRKKKLKELPNTFDRLVNLHSIHLDRNKLSTLPPSIKDAKNLRYISIANNKFDSLPAEICAFKHLRVLDISNNYIPELSDCLGEMIHLEELLMVGVDVGKIPSSMNGLEIKVIDMRMIQMNAKEQAAIKEAFPNTTLRFSKPCNCFDEDEEEDDDDPSNF